MRGGQLNDNQIVVPSGAGVYTANEWFFIEGLVFWKEPRGGNDRGLEGKWGTLGWRPPLSTKVSAVWTCAIGAGLSAIRAAAARHHFQTLDFLAYGFVEDGVGQEDQPVRAGVGVLVLTGFAWAEYARLIGVHSL